jgi:flavin-dependent dehydrogenase
VGLADVGRGITNVAVVVHRARLPCGPTPEARMARLLERFPAVDGRLRRAERISPVRAAGPFAHATTRATSDGVALVGDAADFFDPFTGEGIYAALRGAELLVPHVRAAFEQGQFGARALAGYDRDRRQAFGGKWLLERAIGAVIARPRLLDHVAARLERRPAVADLLVGAAGDFVPPRQVLRPSVAWRLVA